MRGLVLPEGDLALALTGVLTHVTLPRGRFWSQVSSGDTFFIKEAWSDVHPLAVQEGRYSQMGKAGIPGPPPVHYRTVYRIDGPTVRTWSNGGKGFPYRAIEPQQDCHCKGNCQFPVVCSDHHLGNGKRQFWYPARECPERASRLLLEVLSVSGNVAEVKIKPRC
jgi:hypothetical protein